MFQMISLFAIALGFHTLGSQIVTTQQRDSIEPLTVCELLKHRDRFNGKEVSVRGFFNATDEGVWLTSDCADPVVTDGYRWPIEIWIVTARSAYRSPEEFTKAKNAMERLNRELQRLGFRSGQRFWVTCRGTFETDSRLAERVSRNQGKATRGYGFGHLNAAPGQLFLNEAKDPVLERRGDLK